MVVERRAVRLSRLYYVYSWHVIKSEYLICSIWQGRRWMISKWRWDFFHCFWQHPFYGSLQFFNFTILYKIGVEETLSAPLEYSQLHPGLQQYLQSLLICKYLFVQNLRQYTIYKEENTNIQPIKNAITKANLIDSLILFSSHFTLGNATSKMILE